MATFTIKATSIGSNAGPYTIKDNLGNVLATGITRDQILAGYDVEIGDTATSVILESTGTCITSNTINIERAGALSIVSVDVIEPSSCGALFGKSTINATGGSQPYEYSEDGALYQSSNEFQLDYYDETQYPRTVTYYVKDASGSIATMTKIINIRKPTAVISENITNPTSVNADGVIVVNASNGQSPYEYNLNGGAYQSSNTFTNLSSGTYTIGVKDANNCVTFKTVELISESASTRKSIYIVRNPVPKEGLATSNYSPYTSPNVSIAELLADDSSLEYWNVKNSSTEVEAAGYNVSFSFNGVSVTPTYTFTDGQGNNILRSAEDWYKYLVKYIANTDLSTRNAVIKMHRLTLGASAGFSTNVETYIGFTIDFDYYTTDSIVLDYLNTYVYDVFNTPYTISKPSDASHYTTIVNQYNYSGTYGVNVPTTDSSWSVGSTVPGVSSDTISELNASIPSNW